MLKRKERSSPKESAAKKMSEHRPKPTDLNRSSSSTSSVNTIKNKSTTNLLDQVANSQSTRSLASSSSALLSSIVSASRENLERHNDTDGDSNPISADKSFGGTRYGIFVDVLTIDIKYKDGEIFSGNLRKEPLVTKILPSINIHPELIHTIKQGFGSFPFYTVKFKCMIDTRRLPKEYFDVTIPLIQNDGSVKDSRITCFLRGLETRQQRANRREPREDNGIRWVTIDGNFIGMDDENMLKEWLIHFGSILSDFEAETEKIGGVTIGTGRIKVKMQLNDHIPQLVPIHGQRVKFHYRGIKKLCNK